jgi:DNA-binding winged helix-turn-helix (wHTH) protein
MNGLVWRFAGFEYSPHRGLRKNGVQIPVGPQARQLLELLLESQGAVVSKAEIGERLWPGRPPSDDSIDRCAYLLRKPLREAGFGDLIATAYGRGLSLRAKVEAVEEDADVSRPAGDGEADGRILDLWQTAYELAGSLTRDGFARAQSAVIEAGSRNDASPTVWALSANIAATRVSQGYLRPREGASIIERDAGRALKLAADFPAALSVLGWARALLGARLDEGLEMLDRAVARDPFYSKARAHRSWTLARLDRLDEAIEEMDAALQAAPHDRGHLTMRAWLEFFAGDPDKSARLADDGLRLRPDAAGLRTVSAVSASLSGRHAEAEEAAREGLRNVPDDPIALTALAYVLARSERESEAEAALAAAGRDDVEPPPLFRAAAQLALGRPQEAVETVCRGLEEGCPWGAFAAYDLRLAPLRNEIGAARLRG